MSDPVGPQKKIKSSEYHVSFQKLIDGGGTKDSYGGVLSHTSGKTKKGESTEQGYREFQGTVKGKITHTYGVNGENR